MNWQVDIGAKGMTVFVAEGIPEGHYAISAFHDLNGNGELDKVRLLGIPKEPFGFSGNPRIILGAPNFEDCAFVVDEETSDLTLILKEM